MTQSLTITVDELEPAREEGDAVIRTQGKVIVVVDGARLMSLPRSDRVVVFVYREDESVTFARIVARVNGEPLPA